MISNLLKRDDLKETFRNGAIPTSDDFADLIDSVLVKRDDRFFGPWQKGSGYQPGDLVIYGDADEAGLYVLLPPEKTQELAQANGEDCSDDDCHGNKPPGTCYCWQLIRVDSNTWHLIKDGSRSIIYAEMVGRLGVNTPAPDAFFHLNADTEGGGSQLLFNPVGSNNGPRLQLKSGVQQTVPGDAAPLYVDQAIPFNGAQTAVEWRTNVPLGYVFRKETATDDGPVQETLLLLVTSAPNQTPRVGIGTAVPEATLDVASAQNGIRLDADAPQLILLKADGGKKVTQVTQTIANQQVEWTTNALRGFLFSTDDQPLVVFGGQGNVGIGTHTPEKKLEVVARNGQFTFNVDSVNPILTVTNLKDDGDKVNLDLSVEDETTVFETDAKEGFEFRQRDIRTPMLALSRDTNAKKPTFSAMIDGFVQSNGSYIRSLDGTASPLESGLDFLKTLEPKQRSAEGDNHIQMGFVFTGRTGRSSRIAKQFPDKTFGIAQHNLIAMLVRSVQELSEQVDSLQNEINELKKAK